MFVIRKAQLEAFRVPVRQEKRERLLLNLQCTSGTKISQAQDTISIENQRGSVAHLHYSEKNLLREYAKPSGTRYQFDYDEEDRLHMVNIAGTDSLRLDYKDDQPSAITLDGIRLGLNYDAGGRISELLYPDQKSVRFQYSNGQLVAIINRANEKQSYETVFENKLLVHKLTDPLGRVTKLYLDERAALTKIVLPDATSHEVWYDEEEDTEILKLRNGTEKTTHFNGLYARRTQWEDGNYQEIECNDQQAIETLENQCGTLRYEYDEKQRLVSESFQSSAVRYAYEDELLKHIVYPGGLDVEYLYDADDRLRTLCIGQNSCEYQYAANGTVSEIHYPNGLVERQKNRVFSGQQETALFTEHGKVVSKRNYRYDTLGRLSESMQQLSGLQPVKREFAYDDEGRLTTATRNSGHLPETFQYDGKGNIIRAGQQKVVVGIMDEVRSIDGASVQYDKEGNVTSFTDYERGQLKLQYALDGTLKFAGVKNDTWEYWYDGRGRRAGKSNGKETFRYVWAGNKLLTEARTFGGATVLREYIYTDTDTPLAFREGNELYWLQRDVRGAITEVYDSKGTLVWNASYSAFGKATIILDKVRQPWRLAGQYYDEETGLHYNLSRYYSPYLRTFLSLDPQWLEYGAGNYSYAGNDPYNRIDVDGNMPSWLSTTLAVGAGIVVGVAVGFALAAIAPAAVATVLGVMVVGAIAGAVSGAVEPIVKSLLDGEPICWPCVLKSAAIGAALGAVMGPLFKLDGKALAPLGRKIMPKIIKVLPKQVVAIRKGINKLTGIPSRIANEKTHDYAERLAAKKLAKEGFTDIRNVQNNSKQGIDIIARNPKTGAVKSVEVKSTTVSEKYYNTVGPKELPLSKAQQNAAKYTTDRLNTASRGIGRYSHPPELKQSALDAKDLVNEARQNGKIIYEKIDVYLDKGGNLINIISKPW